MRTKGVVSTAINLGALALFVVALVALYLTPRNSNLAQREPASEAVPAISPIDSVDSQIH